MRLSILSLGVSLLSLQVALAQVPPPAQYNILPLAPAPVPFQLNVMPHSSQATLTGIPAMPSTSHGHAVATSPGTSFQRLHFVYPSAVYATPIPPQPVGHPMPWMASIAPASTKPKTRVFEVADLVHAPLQILGAAALENTKGTTAHQLMKLIVAMAKPDTWERHGGAGKIEFIAASDCLCVTNSPEAIAEVTKILDALRRLQDHGVVLEVTQLTAPAGFGAKAGWPTVDDKGKAAPRLCTPEEVKKAVLDMKGDKRVSVMSNPKMTCFDGQAGTFQVLQAVPVAKTSGGPVQAVEYSQVEIGTKFECVPTVSMDGKTIALKLNTVYSALNNGGGVSTIQNRSSVALPCGNSAIVYLGTMTAEERIETRIPAFSKLPYLDRLFRNTGVRTVEQDIYQIVTVRIRKEADVAAPAAPCAKPACGVELNLTAPKPVVVPKQVLSHGISWFSGQ